MKYGIIYRHTNKVNGKHYIGQTTRTNIERRFSKTDSTYKSYKSCPAFFRALNKYGWNNFETEILVSCKNQDSLNKMEEYFIKFYNSVAPFGYNTNIIIEGSVKLNASTKAKISAKQKAYRDSLDVQPEAPNKKHYKEIEGTYYKECGKCKQYKSLDKFGIYKKRWDGLNCYCKECNKANRKKHYVPSELTQEEWKASYKARKSAMSKAQKARFNNPKELERITTQNKQPVIAICQRTLKQIQFSSALEAKKSGFHNVGVSRACKSGKPYKGYIWKKA